MELKDSIRGKIRWLIISFTVLISLFFIGLLILYAWLVEDNIFNRIVQVEARYIEQQYLQTGEWVKPRLPFMSLYRNVNELPETVQVLRQQSLSRIEFPLDDGGTLHLREIQLGGTRLFLAANVSSYEITKVYLPKLIPWVLLVLVIMVICAFALARYLAYIVVNPLQRIALGVAQQKDGKPLQFEQPFASNEIGYLAQTISRSFNRLNAALQRETDFSRDISHELRTPVAVLKMITGRIDSCHPLDELSINRVTSAVNEIEQSLTVLLALSREESVETEKLSLLQEVQHCVINHFTLSKIAESGLNIEISPQYRIICNKNLLHILLNNLLDNVANHASNISLSISLEGHQLTFKNPTAVLPNENVLAPEVKAKNSQGLGQGLHLVKRICEKCEWDVSVNIENDEFALTINLDN